jgi:hypothetical protein
MESQEGTTAAVFAVLAGVFTSALAWTFTCSAQFECLKQGTCQALYDGTCSFSNVVTPAGYRIFNLSMEVSALAALTQGVCAPGERQTTEFASSRVICTRSPAFPDAYVSEAGNPNAAVPHERHCGRWIDSNSGNDGVSFSFFDEQRVEREVQDAVLADFMDDFASSDAAVFQSACQRMVNNMAIAPAAEIAYGYLKKEMGPPANTERVVLKQIGRLNSFYCDTPLNMGLILDDSTNSFGLNMSNGMLLTSETASEMLYAFGESTSTREKARAFVSEMDTAPASLLHAPTDTQLSTIFEGALEDSFASTSYDINGRKTIGLVYGGLPLSKFLYALSETDFEHGRAYLLASAAQCALASRAVVTGEFGAVLVSDTNVDELRRRRAGALSRLRRSSAVGLVGVVNATDVYEATSTKLSHLRQSNAVAPGASASSASAACFSATQKLFPDYMDEAMFNKLVAKSLHEVILGPMVDVLRIAVGAELKSGRTAGIVTKPSDRSKLAEDARNVQFKIAGAPRNSRFGRARVFERPAFKSDDGALSMMLKQARAMFLDRFAMVVDGATICETPPLFDASVRNAYLLNSAPCSMLFPGILVAPFASSRYSEESLYSRIGYIVAHEAAHVASKRWLWDEFAASAILKNYTESSYLEAAADLTAVDAVLATGKVSKERLCAHVSQLWCERSSLTAEPEGFSHPKGNFRANHACYWMFE